MLCDVMLFKGATVGWCTAVGSVGSLALVRPVIGMNMGKLETELSSTFIAHSIHCKSVQNG